jgi:hypothetical protein
LERRHGVLDDVDGRVAAIDVDEVVCSEGQPAQDGPRRLRVQGDLQRPPGPLDVGSQRRPRIRINSVEVSVWVRQDVIDEPCGSAAFVGADFEQLAGAGDEGPDELLEQRNAHAEPVVRELVSAGLGWHGVIPYERGAA